MNPATPPTDPTPVRDRAVTVVGAARSGLAVAGLLARAGARVFLTERASLGAETQADLGAQRIGFEHEGHTDRALEADLFVVSPGVPDTAPLMVEAARRGIPIRSELEVASWFCDAPIVAVTGSNGKTTTTSLVGHVFARSGRTTWVAGNIGTPFSGIVERVSREDVVVLEVSSFQLDHVERFRPHVAIQLNITPDHLDRYDHDFEAYAQAKLKLCRAQGPDDFVVFNRDDERLAAFATTLTPGHGPVPLAITLDSPLGTDTAFVRDGSLIVRLHDTEEHLMRAEELALKGRHNLYNSLAAAVAARVMEVRSDLVRESLQSFEGVPHRLETVRELDGVRYVNDSKATNVNAVWYALESMRERVILIAGGRDKGNDYEPLKPLVREKVRAVIAIGESAATVEAELGSSAEQSFRARSMAEAVQVAKLMAKPGEVVLLSPACASFDQFENYEHRGDTFRRLVADL